MSKYKKELPDLNVEVLEVDDFDEYVVLGTDEDVLYVEEGELTSVLLRRILLVNCTILDYWWPWVILRVIPRFSCQFFDIITLLIKVSSFYVRSEAILFQCAFRLKESS
jgi:hypothetical protein